MWTESQQTDRALQDDIKNNTVLNPEYRRWRVPAPKKKVAKKPKPLTQPMRPILDAAIDIPPEVRRLNRVRDRQRKKRRAKRHQLKQSTKQVIVQSESFQVRNIQFGNENRVQSHSQMCGYSTSSAAQTNDAQMDCHNGTMYTVSSTASTHTSFNNSLQPVLLSQQEEQQQQPQQQQQQEQQQRIYGCLDLSHLSPTMPTLMREDLIANDQMPVQCDKPWIREFRLSFLCPFW